MSDDTKVVPASEVETPVVEPEQTEEKPAADQPAQEPEKVVPESKSEEPQDPPVRRSVKDFIIARKEKKIEKLQQQQPAEDPADEDLTPAARAVIQKEISPVLDVVRKQADEAELAEVFAKYPEARKLEPQIRKHMEAYKDAPIEFIYLGLAAKSGQLNPAEKEKADKEAEESRTGGHTKRPKETSPKSAWDMSEEEFNKEVSKAMRGQ